MQPPDYQKRFDAACQGIPHSDLSAHRAIETVRPLYDLARSLCARTSCAKSAGQAPRFSVSPLQQVSASAAPQDEQASFTLRAYSVAPATPATNAPVPFCVGFITFLYSDSALKLTIAQFDCDENGMQKTIQTPGCPAQRLAGFFKRHDRRAPG